MLREQPAVSVIVPNYNGGELFRDCVRSLSRLRSATETLTVHLVDDGSTDGSVEWLQSEPLPDFIRIHPQAENRGRARTRNVGLRHANGELVVFLDGDLTVEPDFVAEHVRAHVSAGDSVAAVVGRVTRFSDAPATPVARYLYESSARGARQFGERTPVPPQFVLTNNLSVRRDLLDRVGGFDEGFIGYGGEDTHLALEIEALAPGGIRFAAGPVAYDHDAHELAPIVAKFGHYGRVNLARLLDLHPDAERQLHAHWVRGPWWRRTAGRLLFNRPISSLVRAAAPWLPYPVSNHAIRYLLGSAVICGLRESSRAA